MGAAARIAYTTYRDLTEKPEVVELVAGHRATTVNEQFAQVEQIKAFRLLPKELDHEDGELTATQKVKRSAIAEAFGELVESMYASGRRVDDRVPASRSSAGSASGRSTPCWRSGS